jgi:hypothetical protein
MWLGDGRRHALWLARTLHRFRARSMALCHRSLMGRGRGRIQLTYHGAIISSDAVRHGDLLYRFFNASQSTGNYRATFLGPTLNKAALRYTTSSSTFAAWTKLAADLATNGLHARRPRSSLPSSVLQSAIEWWSGGAPVGRPRRWTPACPIPSKPSRHAFPGGKSSRGRGVGTAGLGTTYGTAGGRGATNIPARGSWILRAPARTQLVSSRPVRWIARDAPAGLPPAVRVTSPHTYSQSGTRPRRWR